MLRRMIKTRFKKLEENNAGEIIISLKDNGLEYSEIGKGMLIAIREVCGMKGMEEFYNTLIVTNFEFDAKNDDLVKINICRFDENSLKQNIDHIYYKNQQLSDKVLNIKNKISHIVFCTCASILTYFIACLLYIFK